MAFAIRDLSVLAYANGFTLWHYKSGNDSLGSVTSDNFFADASDMMADGDLVMISGATGCRVQCIARADAGTVISAALS